MSESEKVRQPVRMAMFDFDGTVMEDPEAWPGFGKPNPHVAMMMQECKDAGLEVWIHSSRWSPTVHGEEQAKVNKSDVIKWLYENGLDFYDGLWPADKPLAVFYCDDKAVRPEELYRMRELIKANVDGPGRE